MNTVTLKPPLRSRANGPGDLSNVQLMTPLTMINGEPLDTETLRPGDGVQVHGFPVEAVSAATPEEYAALTVSRSTPRAPDNVLTLPVFAVVAELHYSTMQLGGLSPAEVATTDTEHSGWYLPGRAWAKRIADGLDVGFTPQPQGSVTSDALCDAVSGYPMAGGSVLAIAPSSMPKIRQRVAYRDGGLWLDHRVPVWCGVETVPLGGAAYLMPTPFLRASVFQVSAVTPDHSTNSFIVRMTSTAFAGPGVASPVLSFDLT